MLKRLLTILALIAFLVCSVQAWAGGVLYQVSTIEALLQGVYDGHVSFSDLARQGGFGLGTVDKLNGEMLALDGVFYQVTVDGKVHSIPGDMTTPFANVTHFKPDQTIISSLRMDLPGLHKFISSRLPTPNLFYALRVEGVFPYVKVRSVPGVTKRPYPKLVEIVKNQAIFEFKNVRGTLVGFYSPSFAKGVGVPGYHIHFISHDKTKGGHVLGVELDSVTIKLATLSQLNLMLPTKGSFLKTKLGKDKSSELEKVEKDR